MITHSAQSRCNRTQFHVCFKTFHGPQGRGRLMRKCRHFNETFMMTSSSGNIFRVTDRSPANSPHKGQWRGALMFSLICVWINGWVNNREAGDLRRHRTHHDVIVMSSLAALEVVILTTSSAATDGNFIKMKAFPIQCIGWLYRKPWITFVLLRYSAI